MKCPLIVTLTLLAFATVRSVQISIDRLMPRTIPTDSLKDLILYTSYSVKSRPHEQIQLETQNDNVTPEDKSPDADTEGTRKESDAFAAIEDADTKTKDEIDHSGKKLTVQDLKDIVFSMVVNPPFRDSYSRVSISRSSSSSCGKSEAGRAAVYPPSINTRVYRRLL